MSLNRNGDMIRKQLSTCNLMYYLAIFYLPFVVISLLQSDSLLWLTTKAMDEAFYVNCVTKCAGQTFYSTLNNLVFWCVQVTCSISTRSLLRYHLKILFSTRFQRSTWYWHESESSSFYTTNFVEMKEDHNAFTFSLTNIELKGVKSNILHCSTVRKVLSRTEL